VSANRVVAGGERGEGGNVVVSAAGQSLLDRRNSIWHSMDIPFKTHKSTKFDF
jgi:hypothetical protein